MIVLVLSLLSVGFDMDYMEMMLDVREMVATALCEGYLADSLSVCNGRPIIIGRVPWDRGDANEKLCIEDYRRLDDFFIPRGYLNKGPVSRIKFLQLLAEHYERERREVREIIHETMAELESA